MTESTRECQKAKKIGTEISILGAFVALSKLVFTILSSELSFALSRIQSRPVSVFQTESRFVLSRQKLVTSIMKKAKSFLLSILLYFAI